MSFKPQHPREKPDDRRYLDDADRWLREHGHDQAKEDDRRRARQRAAASRHRRPKPTS